VSNKHVHPLFEEILEIVRPVPLCDCGKPVCERDEFEERCEECLASHEQNAAEAAYERQQEEGFRGGEYAAWLAAEQAEAQKLK